MNESSWYLLLTLGLALLLGLALMLLTRDKRAYDERQRLAQGTAYQAAFYTLVSLLSAVTLAQELLEQQWFSTLLLVTGSILVSVGVFAVVCILKDAYVAVRQSPVTIYVCMGLFILAQLFSVGERWQQDGLMVDGRFTSLLMPLLAIAVYAVIGAVLLCKQLRDRRRSREDAS